MATSSILTNIVIREPKKAEALANALEESSNVPKRRLSGPTMPVLSDRDKIRELMAKKVQKK